MIAKHILSPHLFLIFFEIKISDMKFFKIGNKKNYQHYKSVLEIILIDILGNNSDRNLDQLLKKVYKN